VRWFDGSVALPTTIRPPAVAACDEIGAIDEIARAEAVVGVASRRARLPVQRRAGHDARRARKLPAIEDAVHQGVVRESG